MADLFGDAALFAEFERDRGPDDKILRTKFVENEKVSLRRELQSNSSVNGGDDEEEMEDSSSGGSDSDADRDADNAQESLADQFRGETKFSDIKAELQQMKQKYNRLKRRCRMLDPNKYFEDEDGPSMQIMYMNNDFARKYRSELESFLFKLLRKEKSQKDTYQLPPSLALRPNAVILADEKLQNPQDKMRLVKSSTVIGCAQVYRDFTVDAMGWPLVDYNPSLTDGWDVPRYEQVFSDPLPQEESDEDEVSLICPRPKRAKASCFNCGGDHQLNDCKEPRDPRKISENRNKFMMEKAANNMNNSARYHIEDDPKFARFKPGRISDDLREALGLGAEQLPPYIYRMRNVGYPPGHLENARVQTSGISLFDKHGNEVKADGECMEDGEVELEEQPKSDYDVAKLIEYPGFNVDPPEGYVDEHRRYGARPMMPHDRKSVLEAHLGTKTTTPAQKRSRDRNESSSSKKRRRGSDDMDLDSSGEESPHPPLDSGVDESRMSGAQSPPSSPHTHLEPTCYIPPYMYIHMHTLPALDPAIYNPSITPQSQALHPFHAQQMPATHTPPPPPPPLPSSPPPLPPPPPDSPPASPVEPLTQQTTLSDTIGPREIPLEKETDPFKISTPFYSPKSEPEALSPPRPSAPLPVVDTARPVDEEAKVNTSVGSPFKTPRTPLRLPPPKDGSTPLTAGIAAPPLPEETPPRAPPLPDGTPPPTPPNTEGLKSQLAADSFHTPVGQSLRPPSSASSGGSLSVSLGTPVLDGSDSIRDKGLPDAAKFKSGISDHMFFENLPDSTGKYDKMRKLVAQVRNKLTK